jgi:hypothetical protein
MMTDPPLVAALARSLPDQVAAALLRARRMEATASGAGRWLAFRVTRNLITGVLQAGYPAQLIADCLQLQVGSVRDRGAADGWLTADQAAVLAGVPADEPCGSHAPDRLNTRRVDEHGQEWFLARELVALLAARSTPPDSSAG